MKKALKDTQTKALLKYINKERRRAYWDMQTPNLYIFFFLAVLACVIFSYNMFETRPWLSNFFQSCGTGIITGIVVFVLGNVRSQSKEDADRIIEQLTRMYEIIKKVYDSVPDKLTRRINGKNYNYKDCVIETINAAMEYVEAIKKLEFSLQKKFIRETSINYYDMAVNIDKFTEMDISDDLTYYDAIEIRNDIIYIIQNAADWFEAALRKAEMQKEQIRKYPF